MYKLNELVVIEIRHGASKHGNVKKSLLSGKIVSVNSDSYRVRVGDKDYLVPQWNILGRDITA